MISKDFALRHDKIITLIFIVIFLIIFFPIKELILRYLLKKKNYFSFQIESFSALDFSKNSLSLESLVRKDFPNLMEWLQLSSGSLAIIDASRKFYRIYHYNGKNIISINILERTLYTALSNFLLKHPKGVSIADPFLPKKIKLQITNLDTSFIYPLIYNNVVIGLFLFKEKIHKKHLGKTFEIFRYRAGLSIQNQIISQRVIDNRVYEYEFKVASRIQENMKSKIRPEISHYEVKAMTQGVPHLSEFLKLGEGHWLSVIIVCIPFTSVEGIRIYSLIGQLYSMINLEKAINLNLLFNSIKNNKDWQSETSSINLLLIKLDEKSKEINLISNQEKFSLGGLAKKNVLGASELLKSNKIKNVKLNLDDELTLLYGKEYVLSIINNKKEKNY